MSQNNNDLFGYEDIFEDNKSKADFEALIGVIIRLILAITTGGFFYLFVGDLFNWLAGPLYSPYISAITGVFTIDGLAYFWSKLRQRRGNTETQLTSATIGTIGNNLLSVLVTIVFIILLTDFIAIRDANGQLNDIGQAVNIAGLLIATIAIGGNGLLWAYYDANTSNVRQALSAAKLTAARFAGTFAIEDRRNRMTIGRTMEELKAALPRLTDDAAARNRAKYLLENFTRFDTDGDGRISDQELRQASPRNGNGQRRRYEQVVTAPPRQQTDSNEKLVIYRILPGAPRRPLSAADTYQEAMGIIYSDGDKRPPGTVYRLFSNGKQIKKYTVTDNLEQSRRIRQEDDNYPVEPAVPNNGRPTPPQS